MPSLHADPLNQATSRRLSRVPRMDTAPERIVRAVVRALGLRYRLSNRDLPGSPDLANRRKKWAIFVHGCFWHRHKQCRLAYTPKSRVTFWTEKFRRNVERDHENAVAMRKLGWRVVTVWECEAASPDKWIRKIGASK